MTQRSLPSIPLPRYSPDQRNLQTTLDTLARTVNQLTTSERNLDRRIQEVARGVVTQERDSPSSPTAAPPNPTNLTGTGLFQSVVLSWTAGLVKDFAYTEIWRASTDNRGNATRRGTSQSTVFSDSATDGQTYYYWIRHVNQDNIAGPWNAANGTQVTTQKITNDSVTSIAVDKLVSGSLTAGTYIKGGTFYGGRLRLGVGSIIREDETGTDTGYGLVVDANGDVDIAGSVSTGGSSQKMVLNSTTNEAEFFGDRGDGTIEKLATIGITPAANTGDGQVPDDVILNIGGDNVARSGIVVEVLGGSYGIQSFGDNYLHQLSVGFGGSDFYQVEIPSRKDEAMGQSRIGLDLGWVKGYTRSQFPGGPGPGYHHIVFAPGEYRNRPPDSYTNDNGDLMESDPANGTMYVDFDGRPHFFISGQWKTPSMSNSSSPDFVGDQPSEPSPR